MFRRRRGSIMNSYPHKKAPPLAKDPVIGYMIAQSKLDGNVVTIPLQPAANQGDLLEANSLILMSIIPTPVPTELLIDTTNNNAIVGMRYNGTNYHDNKREG